jgi:hypothetical protein
MLGRTSAILLWASWSRLDSPYEPHIPYDRSYTKSPVNHPVDPRDSLRTQRPPKAPRWSFGSCQGRQGRGGSGEGVQKKGEGGDGVVAGGWGHAVGQVTGRWGRSRATQHPPPGFRTCIHHRTARVRSSSLPRIPWARGPATGRPPGWGEGITLPPVSSLP